MIPSPAPNALGIRGGLYRIYEKNENFYCIISNIMIK